MAILSKNHSSYPRIGNKPEQQKLRQAYNKFDLGKNSAEQVAQILDSTVAEIINEQLAGGCDIITDGQIRCADPLSYIAGKIKGFEIGGLRRFFDTNFLYRQPKIISRLNYDKPLVADDFNFAKKISKDKASVIMFGPYSLLKMSMVEKNFEGNLADLTEIYIKEIIELKAGGARLIQLDEPAILHNPHDLGIFESSYQEIMAQKEIPEIMTGLYFGNAVPMIDKLAGLPVDGICFDFTYSPGLAEALNGFSRNIGLGLIDGRNTKMEKQNELIDTAGEIINKIKSERVYITSSCGLEFLPRDRAFAKLKLCADTAKSLAGVHR